MNGKKTTTLCGKLVSPLTIGDSATIRWNGRVLRTSKVVTIHHVGNGIVRFETQNTYYTVLNPVSVQAVSIQMPVCAAA